LIINSTHIVKKNNEEAQNVQSIDSWYTHLSGSDNNNDYLWIRVDENKNVEFF